jgi:hypothetical protein
MRPGHLAAHSAACAANPSLGFVCGAIDVIDEDNRPIPSTIVERPILDLVDRHFAPGAFVAELVASNPVRCSAVTLSKAVHATAGGFDPAFRYVVDWEFWLRVARRWPVAWLANPTVAVRWHEASETHRFKEGTADLEEIARLIESMRANDVPNLSGGETRLRMARERLARAFLNRAYESSCRGDGPLVRRCFLRAIRLWPGAWSTVARDPRLAARLALSALRSPRTNQPCTSP